MTDQNGDEAIIAETIKATLEKAAEIANMLAENSETIEGDGRRALRSFAVILMGSAMPQIIEMITDIILSPKEDDTIQ